MTTFSLNTETIENPINLKNIKKVPERVRLSDTLETGMADFTHDIEEELEYTSYRAKKMLMPKNPLFDTDLLDEGDPFLKSLKANSDGTDKSLFKKMPHIKAGSILRRRLVRCLKKMKQLKLTPSEVKVWKPIVIFLGVKESKYIQYQTF